MDTKPVFILLKFLSFIITYCDIISKFIFHINAQYSSLFQSTKKSKYFIDCLT